MAITNHDRVGRALELLRDGLRPYIEREFEAKYPKVKVRITPGRYEFRHFNLAGRATPHLRRYPFATYLGSFRASLFISFFPIRTPLITQITIEIQQWQAQW